MNKAFKDETNNIKKILLKNSYPYGLVHKVIQEFTRKMKSERLVFHTVPKRVVNEWSIRFCPILMVPTKLGIESRT